MKMNGQEQMTNKEENFAVIQANKHIAKAILLLKIANSKTTLSTKAEVTVNTSFLDLIRIKDNLKEI